MKFIHAFNTYSLFYNKIDEGLIKTHPLKDTIGMIERYLINYRMKYNIENVDYEKNVFEFKIEDFNYNDLIYDKLCGIESVIVNMCGHFPSLVKINYVSGMKNSKKWHDNMWEELVKYSEYYSSITIKFESKFDDFEDCVDIDYLYHITNNSYVDKILKSGLVPKSKNKLSTHPDRIYLCKTIQDCENLKIHMYNSDKFNNFGMDYKKENNKSLEYTILKIDIKDLKIKIFKDPNYKQGYYIINNIEPSRIDK
jgi:hypothetical protein